MEMVERFALDGTPTGEPISRSRAHAEGIPHSTAHIWIIRSDNHILLQKRASCKESRPDLWDVSSAGHIAYGESALDSAVRECEEEIGIAVHSSELEPAGWIYQEYFEESAGFYDREWVQLFLLRRDFSIDECTLQPEEVSAVRWISISEFAELVQKKSSELVDHWDEYHYLIKLLCPSFESGSSIC